MKGLKQGFLFSKKIREIANRKDSVRNPATFLQQILDIAKRKGVDYE